MIEKFSRIRNEKALAKTRYWKVDVSVNPETPAIQEAASLIRDGRLIAFPTETVYGLGANACDDAAVRAIFQAKGRPSDNPLIVHIAHLDQLKELVHPLTAAAETLMERFWPGPLTVVLPLIDGAVSPIVSAGLNTLAVRMPAHPAALSLIEAAGVPIAAPSANLSGRPSPTSAMHVLEDLDGKISGIIDGGDASLGIESTVVLMREHQLEVLRPGGISIEELAAALPEDVVLQYEHKTGAGKEAPRSPGMKYTHYAPKGELVIVQGQPDKVQSWIQAQMKLDQQHARRTGILAFHSPPTAYSEADHVIHIGRNMKYAAARLYAALREFDQKKIDMIYSEACPEEGLGYAVMNRLRKASGNKSVLV